VALGDAALGVGVSARVLMVGAHPDDEDTFLIAWLSRGRHLETAYLSLTRGDGGQNLIGNELGEALGVLRTEELLAARRVDGGGQYFTRAFDFGFSKDTLDTFAHWDRDSILGDVVRVVRAFRPHVIVAVFSGTPRDGHGHHQVSGLLARAAWDASADTSRFPQSDFGPAWSVAKLYGAARGNAAAGTLGINVGEWSPLHGRSYAEIAGQSRSQHKSQGFGALERKGPVLDYVRREASRVNEGQAAADERSLFDGLDTTWTRFRNAVDRSTRGALDSLPAAFRSVREAYQPLAPSRLLAPLARVHRLLETVCPTRSEAACGAAAAGDALVRRDLEASVSVARRRATEALALAAGIEADAFAGRELVAADRAAQVVTHVYNNGSDTVRLPRPLVLGAAESSQPWQRAGDTWRAPGIGWDILSPGGVRVDTLRFAPAVAQPWWLEQPRAGAMFPLPARTRSETEVPIGSVAMVFGWVRAPALTGDGPVVVQAPITHRFVDQVNGEVRRPAVGAPAITIRLASAVEYAPAGVELDRPLHVTLRSVSDSASEVTVRIQPPPGLRTDSATRTVRLESGATEALAFRVRGTLAPGRHEIGATAISDGRSYSVGFDEIAYDHIRPRRLYRPARTTLVAVNVQVPASLRVAYVPGVSDNVAAALEQLGVPVTVISAVDLPRADLSRFTTVVIGPRAYEAHPDLVSANPRLMAFAAAGGTVVVQYGQYEMTRPGHLPHAITIARPHTRVTNEQAPVTLVHPDARELRWPNAITAGDFAGWVQERALYMPRTFDERWTPLLEMGDPGEAPNRGALLVARTGRGAYVYTTLAFFRQLPAGVPGAARLFVNLLSASLPAPPP